jgi:hypothetical protein
VFHFEIRAFADIISLDPGLLFVLSMVRHSTLPERINQGIGDLSVLEEEELRRFGETIQVYFSDQHRQLDVAGCPLSTPSLGTSAEPLIGTPSSYESQVDHVGLVVKVANRRQHLVVR